MRATVASIAVVAVLAFDQPGFAQGTSPSAAPKQPQAPVGHRQPRPTDVNAARLPPPRPATPAQTDEDPDQKLNRVLNSICRGC